LKVIGVDRRLSIEAGEDRPAHGRRWINQYHLNTFFARIVERITVTEMDFNNAKNYAIISAVTGTTAIGSLCFRKGLLSERFENRRSDFK
jgi:hypothetical protein